MSNDLFSFQLPKRFVDSYETKPVDWGYTDAGGNSLGEITFVRTYSRLKEDGSKERWHEVCERVINGMYSIQKDHARANRLPWTDEHALESATEAYDRMFHFKWLPPGRGLWMMGTEYVMRDRDSASLNNCGFVDTADFPEGDPASPFAFLMEASMLGIGIGFNTNMADLDIHVRSPHRQKAQFKVEDSREGWVDSVRLLINSYLTPGHPEYEFDYSGIRPAGAPIKGFGGTAAGAEPLVRLHTKLTEIFTAKLGERVDTELVVDIANLIGVCVVAGNVRRCLPEGTRVRTESGLVAIENLSVGDQVVTAAGTGRIAAVLNQGEQDTLLLVTEEGHLECTGKHQVAVYVGEGAWDFKRAQDLQVGDLLVRDSFDQEEASAKPSRITEIRNGRAMVPTWDIEVEDIHQFTAEGFVVHNSALIALGKPEDDEFIHLKDPERFPERNSYNPDNPGWGWMSNNSVYGTVGMDYSHLIDSIATNGEPGIVWMDTIRAYGRTGDEPDHRDYRAAGVNPCLSGETLIMTTEGPRRIDSIDKPFWAVVNGKAYRATASWSSGIKPIFKLRTKEGHSIRLTEDHKVLTPAGMVPAGELSPGDKIVINDHRNSAMSWSGSGDEAMGYLAGMFKGDGDGEYGKRSAAGRIEGGSMQIKVWEKDQGSKEMAQAALAAAELLGGRRSDFSGWRAYRPGVAGMTLRKEWLSPYMELRAGKPLNEDAIATASSDFQRGFVRGLLDTDGHLEGWQERSDYKGISIRLGQVDRNTLEVVQRILLRFGILSTIYTGKKAGISLLPDGKGGHREYPTKALYRLAIGAASVKRFNEVIGFHHGEKKAKLENAVARHSFYDKAFEATFESLTYEEDGEVYDLTVDEVHMMDAGGLLVSNCSEQPLESYELCTLVEVFLNRHDTLEDFKRTLKFAYMYGKTVTLVPTRWPETNAVMQRNRRIGCSISGLAEFADTKSLPVLKDWMNAGYEEVRRWDRIYSEWLCIRESIRVTTLKPSGSVSILSGATPGVHWAPGGKNFLRAIRFASDDPVVPLFEQAGYTVEDDVVSANTKVVYFPVHTNQKRAEKDVSIFEKVNLAAFAQKHWSDNAVSVTVSFDPAEEAKYIETTLHMHEGTLKAVSFLPSGNKTYPQMPYTQISEEEYQSYVGKLAQVNFEPLYNGQMDALDAAGEAYCTTDKCELKVVPAAAEFEDETDEKGALLR